MCCVCICIAVQYLPSCWYTGNTPTNLWISKQSVHKINSRHHEQTVNKMSAYTTHSHVQQSTLFAFHPIHLFQECKIALRFPLNSIRSTLWSLRNCSTATQVTNLTTTIPKQASCRSIHLTVLISLSVTRKRLNPPNSKMSQITHIKQKLTQNGQWWETINAWHGIHNAIRATWTQLFVWMFGCEVIPNGYICIGREKKTILTKFLSFTEEHWQFNIRFFVISYKNCTIFPLYMSSFPPYRTLCSS
jgi:hypothetical protein